jgi:hypothetical protein
VWSVVTTHDEAFESIDRDDYDVKLSCLEPPVDTCR